MTTLLLGIALGAALAGCGSGNSGGSTPGSAATSTTRTVRHPTRPEVSVSPLLRRSFPRAPTREQTHPAVSPSSGSTTTVFTLHLTARETLGPRKGVRYAYMILLRGAHPRCSVFTELTIARAGARVPVALRPPIELGWCRGAIRGQVLLQTSPNCAPTAAAAQTHCTTFAPRLADAGRFGFHAR